MLLVALAHALTPIELDDRLRSMGDLELEPELYRRVEEPITIASGGAELTLTSGVMVPVFSGRFQGAWAEDGKALLRRLRRADPDATLPDEAQRGSRELVGFVWLHGEGSLALTFPTRGDAQLWANRQVLFAGADREAMAPVARGDAPFETTADRGVFLSADPRLDAWFLGGHDGDPFEVVVYPDPDDLSGAQALLDARIDLWEVAGIDWTDRLARDRVNGMLGHEAPPVLLADVRTSTQTRLVSTTPGSEPDRWMAVLEDGTGETDTRWASQVVAAGLTPQGIPGISRITGAPFPPSDPGDPTSPRRPPGAVERVSARAQVFVEQTPGGAELAVEHRTRVTLRATVPTAYVELRLPRTEAVPGTFEVVGVEIDGQAAVAPAQARRRDAEVTTTTTTTTPDGEEKDVEEVDASRVRVVLPEVLPAGETVAIHLRWKDTWPYANWLACGVIQGQAVERPSGQGSGLQGFLPDVTGADGGGPWTYIASIAVPEGAPFEVALSGAPGEPEVADGWRVHTTTKTVSARYPNVAVGRWKTLRDPAQKGFPAINAHLFQAFPGQLEQMAPEARRVISYYQGWLPPFPVDEMDIVESPSACGGFVWIAPHGMASLQRMVVGDGVGGGVKAEAPRLEHAVYAHEIAHQYFGQLAQPGSPDDRWMIESFAEAYACMYVAATFDKARLCEVRMDAKRQRWETGEQVDLRYTASLRHAFRTPLKNEVVYGYGPVVLLEMLRPRVGNEAFFGAVDLMLRDHPREGLTEERLQAYLQGASGKDLGPFFDFWVAGGLVPAVSAAWTPTGSDVSVEVTGDVPFGTFDIPVTVTDKERSETVWVTVTDGSGSARVPGPWRKPSVALDPDGRTLARGRTVRRVKP